MMDDFGYLLVQMCNFSLLLAWIVAALAALFQLRKTSLPPTPKAIWALLVSLVPLLGAAAFFIVRPGGAEGENAPQA